MSVGVARREHARDLEFGERLVGNQLARHAHATREPLRSPRVRRDRDVPSRGRRDRTTDVIAMVMGQRHQAQRTPRGGLGSEYPIEHRLLIGVRRPGIDQHLLAVVGSDQIRVGMGGGRQGRRPERKHPNPRRNLAELRRDITLGCWGNRAHLLVQSVYRWIWHQEPRKEDDDITSIS
jgi:hypothetical protein